MRKHFACNTLLFSAVIMLVSVIVIVQLPAPPLHRSVCVCSLFEEMLIRSGTILIKYWFFVNDEEQGEKLFQVRNPIKRWKLSPMDLQSPRRWADYSKAKDRMFSFTDTKQSPWHVVNADNKEAGDLLNSDGDAGSRGDAADGDRQRKRGTGRNARGHDRIDLRNAFNLARRVACVKNGFGQEEWRWTPPDIDSDGEDQSGGGGSGSASG
jgi:hypothetical protein